MKVLIDMNLSPEWVQEFKLHNIEAIHWSGVGKFDAPDETIIAWAIKNEHLSKDTKRNDTVFNQDNIPYS